MAASSLHRNEVGFLRRLKARLGPAKEITATARKLAVIVYSMLKNGDEYVEAGLEAYEKKYQDRLVKKIKKKATKFFSYSILRYSPKEIKILQFNPFKIKEFLEVIYEVLYEEG